MRSKAAAVIGAEIRRRAHAAQQDSNVTRRQPLQDCIERGARHLGLDAAQHVVGAEFDDDRIGALRHRPIEPGKPVGGGIAGDAGIGDVGADAVVGQRRLQPRHEAVFVGKAVARGQRIAERDDMDRRCARARAMHPCCGKERHATNRGDLAERAPPPI